MINEGVIFTNMQTFHKIIEHGTYTLQGFDKVQHFLAKQRVEIMIATAIPALIR